MCVSPGLCSQPPPPPPPDLRSLQELLEEAELNHYSCSEVCDELRATIQEVCDIASTAREIAGGGGGQHSHRYWPSGVTESV